MFARGVIAQDLYMTEPPNETTRPCEPSLEPTPNTARSYRRYT